MAHRPAQAPPRSRQEERRLARSCPAILSTVFACRGAPGRTPGACSRCALPQRGPTWPTQGARPPQRSIAPISTPRWLASGRRLCSASGMAAACALAAFLLFTAVSAACAAPAERHEVEGGLRRAAHSYPCTEPWPGAPAATAALSALAHMVQRTACWPSRPRSPTGRPLPRPTASVAGTLPRPCARGRAWSAAAAG